MDNTSQKAEAYGKAVDDALIEAIRLVSSSFTVSQSFRSNDSNIKRFVNQKVLAPNYDEATSTLVGLVQCHCWMELKEDVASSKKAASDSKDTNDHLLSIKASYVLMFKFNGPHDDSVVKTFFSRMAALTVWPYFRVHVASVAAEGGVNIPVLPIKKLVQKVRAAENYVDPDE